MFGRPKNLISKGATGLLLLANRVLADDSDGMDASDPKNQIGLYTLVGIAALAVSWCTYRLVRSCCSGPAAGQAEPRYYGHYDQMQDFKEQNERARRAGNNV